MKMSSIYSIFITTFFVFQIHASESQTQRYWIKAAANDALSRTEIANSGADITLIDKDFVVAIATDSELNRLRTSGRLLEYYSLTQSIFDFPEVDSAYHNYDELTKQLQQWQEQNKDIIQLERIGQSTELRDIFNLRISENTNPPGSRPAVAFIGGHHAREHLSVEITLQLAAYLIGEYRAGNPRIVTLIRSREINIIPNVNPDGSENDIKSGTYKYWRKNMTPYGNSVGVDLNRNYGFKWGQEGSSHEPNSETYRGPQPFSEPETQAIKSFIENHNNLSILLTFHSYSEQILYPWGHTFDPIGKKIGTEQDFLVHRELAARMAQINNYTPKQTSSLYLTSGDTMDWSYGEHQIISFTFELEPQNGWGSSFYPGPGMIPTSFNKNLEPCLMLMELSDNPYRVLSGQSSPYGVNEVLTKTH